MKLLRPFLLLLLFVAISACTPVQRKTAVAPPPAAPVAQPKPLVAAPPVATTVQVLPMSGAVFDAARADIDAGLAAAALVKLDALNPEQLNASQKQQWHSLRASAYSLQGSLLNAVRERVATDSLLTDPAVRQRNQEAIIEALTLMPSEQLSSYPVVAGDALSGWLSLGRILVAHESAEILQQNLSQWRLNYPGHAADGALLSAYLNRSLPAAAARPAKSTSVAIAALLPTSGTSAAYGEAVRQGITFAHDSDATSPKPVLRLYDSETGDVLALYRQALAEGADVVIGPLRKEQVVALADAGDLPKPVLALNQIDAQRDNFFQFGLLPEDELTQAANLARQEGRQHALLLIPARDFGQRMATHFNDSWQSQGGQVVAVQTYPPGEKDYATLIKKLLHVGEPSKDHPQTPRTDIDAIFLIAESRDARMLVPQLRYYGATRLPIYATSMVYSGRPNRPQDQDLAGVIFCDAPWLLAENSAAQRQTAWETWGTAGSNPRLWAMGMDAYRLSQQLGDLQNTGAHFEGASGDLSLKPGNRFYRQLLCAQFDGGLPTPYVNALLPAEGIVQEHPSNKP